MTITTTFQRSTQSRSPSDDPATTATNAVTGIVDLSGNRAFVRTSGFRQGRDDVSVSPQLIQQYGLRAGDQITGAARMPRQASDDRRPREGTSGEKTRASRQNPGIDRQAHRALVRVDTICGLEPCQASARPRFDDLTPLHPQERLRLEPAPASAQRSAQDGAAGSPTARIIDLVSPVGKGQRGLIVAPPKAGKTMVLQAIATAVAVSHPEVHLMVVLVGERPEEVTDLRRSVRGEVAYSTFDQSAHDHISVAELAIERAKRLVELGRDVVVLLDSVTRLGRAYNLVAPASSRILAGGVATSALQPPRQFLGAARNLEEGGSLTILSTALVETGSRMDDVFFEEFKGTGNMELRLRRDLAEKRLYPAIDVAPSGTRRDDLLLAPDERAAVDGLRRALHSLDAQQALELLLDKTRETSSNVEFLRQVQASPVARRRRAAQSLNGAA